MNENVSQESILAAAITLGSGIVKILGPKVASDLVEKAASAAGSTVIKHTRDKLKAGGDLVSATQSARVEPILLMDQRAANIPFIQDVVHSVYNLFTGYWLLSVSLDTKINNVSVGRRLDKFATDRDLANATAIAIDKYLPDMNSMDIGLPYAKEIMREQFESMEKASLEANKPTDEERAAQAAGNSGSRVVDPAKVVQQITNLAVGQIVEVVISEDGKEAKVPVMIRLRVAGMNPKAMVETLAIGGADMTTRGRYRAWRAGELSFWADFVLAMDRVDQHRAASMNDETGYYKAMYDRATKNDAVALLGNGPSLATASSIIVITTDTAAELERKIGGELSSFRVRQGIFGMTYSMLLAVVDPEWESVVIYTRGIEMPTKLNARDMKTAGKSDSKELMDILKSYQMGKAPGRP